PGATGYSSRAGSPYRRREPFGTSVAAAMLQRVGGCPMFAATSLPRAPTAGVAQATRAPGVIALLLGIALAVCAVQPVRAAAAPQPQERSQDPIRNMDALSVVLLRAVTPKDAASAATLGAQREGSGIVIDSSGLILTIGYLIVEA